MSGATCKLVNRMTRTEQLKYLAGVFATILLVACQQSTEVTPVGGTATQSVAAKPAPQVDAQTSPGKPSAPVQMRYEVLGNPVVGAPVAINVEIDAAETLGPVRVRYSIADSGALSFQPGQVVDLELTERRPDHRAQQLAVIPQREGRLYVNVSAEVQTAGGAMIKSMAIPIQVGSAPNQPTTNGDLKEGPDGETVISLPANETN